MDHTAMNDLYTDEQLGSDVDQEVATAIENHLKDVHTCLPGKIVSYDPVANTAVVQPAIQRVFVEGGPTNLPLLLDVPVYFPGGGDFTVTFPVAAGDECVLFFSERCIDFWHAQGDIKPPAVYRLHDLSDAFAFVGIRNQKRRLANIQTDGMELRNADRSVAIKLTSTGIQVLGNITSTGTIQAQDVIVPSSVPNVNITLSTHEHTPGNPQTGKPVPPLP